MTASYIRHEIITKTGYRPLKALVFRIVLIGLSAGLWLLAPGVQSLYVAAFIRAIPVVIASTFCCEAYVTYKRSRSSPARTVYDFGWAFAALNYGWMLSLALFGCAIVVQMIWGLWVAAFVLLMLAVNAFGNNSYMRISKHVEWSTLPLVDLFKSNRVNPAILDLGCGSGRTTVALSRCWPDGATSTGVDLFSAGYIDGGGRSLMEHNMKVAGISSKVTMLQGDMTDMKPLFKDSTFDCGVSTFAMDHLGPETRKLATLREIHRVLKPGGRFLFVLWVPGTVTFLLANIACLIFTTESKWREMAGRAGLKVEQCGYINGAWYMLAEKP